MATFEEKYREQIARANKYIDKLANAMGPDFGVESEGFYNNIALPESSVMKSTPTASTSFASPEYGDALSVPGSVGTRYGVTGGGTIAPVRLYSYLPSGQSGPDSCQTFFVVTSAPSSHDLDDIQAVRQFPLIGPQYSPGRSHAAETSTSVRGFRMALYPAKNNGGTLEADTTNGPIPSSADPSGGDSFDPAGSGSAGEWYVDYDAGVVRFTAPPLNGSQGIMNPNDVYGDRTGSYDPDGAITMFAVFYAYSGSFGVGDRPLAITTVGDNLNSFGDYSGSTENTWQSAINSLPDTGGTVFIKSGTYTFSNPVDVPDNVKIIGTGGARVIVPDADAALVIGETANITDGYQEVSGIQFYLSDTYTGTDPIITLKTSAVSTTVMGVKIHNNLFYSQVEGAIGWNSANAGCTYKYLEIKDNVFLPGGATAKYIVSGGGSSVAVSECQISGNFFEDDGNTVSVIDASGFTLANCDISNNNMSDCVVDLTGAGNSINDLRFIGNEAGSLLVNNGLQTLTRFICTNNILGDIDLDILVECVIKDNAFNGGFSISGGLTDVQISGNVYNTSTGGLTIGSTNILTRCNVSNNLCSSTVVSLGALSNSYVKDNTFSAAFVCGDSTNSVISGNYIVGTCTCGGLSGSDFSNNVCGSNTEVGQMVTSSLVTNKIGGYLYIDKTGDPNEIVAYQSVIYNNIAEYVTVSSNGTIRKSAFSCNVFTASSSTNIFSSIFQSVVSSNYFGGDVSIIRSLGTGDCSRAVESSVIGNNVFNNALNIDNQDTTRDSVVFSVISGNTMDVFSCGDLLTGTLSGRAMWAVNVAANYINDDCTVGNASRGRGTITLQGVSFLSNFLGNLTLNGKGTSTMIQGNFMEAVYLAEATLSNISGNVFSGLSATSSAGNNLFEQVIFSNNYVDGNTTLNVGSSAGSVFYESSCDANYFNGNLTVGAAITSTDVAYVLNSSSFSNNFVNGASISFANGSRSDATDTYLNSNISNNAFVATSALDFYGNVIGSVFSGNQFVNGVSGVSFGGLETTNFSGNVFTGTSCPVAVDGHISYSLLNNNYFAYTVDFNYTGGTESLLGTSLSNNYFTNAITIDDNVSGCVISGNNMGLSAVCTINGALELSICVANGSLTNFLIESSGYSVISSNRFATFRIQSASGGLYYSLFTNNYATVFSVMPTTGSIYQSMIISNFFNGTVNFEQSSTSTTNSVFEQSVFSSNVCNSTFEIKSSTSSNSATCVKNGVFNSNIFLGSLTVNSVSNVGSGPFSGLSFIGNVLNGTTNIYSFVDGDSIFTNGVFVGNILDGSLIIGSSSRAHKIEGVVVGFNVESGVAGIYIYNDVDNNLPGVIVVGNSCPNGTLYISSVSGAGNYQVPPADANDPIVALNRFGTYTGAITYDSTKSLGWGTGDSGSIIGTNK